MLIEVLSVGWSEISVSLGLGAPIKVFVVEEIDSILVGLLLV